MKVKGIYIGLICLLFFSACRKDKITIATGTVTPYEIVVPSNFVLVPKIKIPADNPTTVQGIELGRNLFYEKLLSGDNSQACATCHMAKNGFNDPLQFSVGIDGIAGTRHSMPLFNIAWIDTLFWDGRSIGLEAQALVPVTDPIEMHNTWPEAVAALQATDKYPALFEAAFGTDVITQDLTAKALAQFERTLLSTNSPFDRERRGEPTGLTGAEIALMKKGLSVFQSEAKGDCFHCHGTEFNPLFTDNSFRNNALDSVPIDAGRGGVTGKSGDFAKFKVPSVRNLLFTAPYMHDGRFETIREVIEHYNSGLQKSATVDVDMKNIDDGGAFMHPDDIKALEFFLECLSDSSFINNPAFQDPALD